MTIPAAPALPVRGNKDTFPALADAYFSWISNTLQPAFNADITALNLNSTTDTSASSVLIGVGSKSFTVSTAKSFQPGMYIVMASTAAPTTNSMVGQIASYNTGTGALVVNVVSVQGSGTISAWSISQSAAPASGLFDIVKTTTALADAAATLTAAQLIGGEFTITPTVARILTTDTAVNIIAAMVGSVDNNSVLITVVNNAAFDVSIAAGAGVTLVGRTLINSGSATWRMRRLTSTTVSFTRVDGVRNGLGDGQTWQDLTASRALSTNYTNTAGRSIAISIYWYASSYSQGTLIVGGAVADNSTNSSAGIYGTARAIVPPGAVYAFSASNGSIGTWSELR